MSATLRAEPVTAGVKGWLEDRLHDLEHRLLNHPIHNVGNPYPPLPATWLWQPYAANIAGPIASLQQVTAHTGDDGRGFRLRRFDRLTVHSWRSLVAHYVQQRLGQIGLARCFLEQPTGVGRAGAGTARLLAPRFLQQKASPLAGRDSLGNLREVQVHCLCVAGRQDQGRGLALLRADRAEDVGGSGTLITGSARAGAALCPPAGDLVLLADTSLVLEPDFYLVAVERLLAGDFVQARGEVFL